MTLFRARPVVVLLAVFALLGAVFAVTTPLFEASDELWHYPMVQQLSRGGPLPVQDPANVGAWRQEASQPPLYYYLMGWATAWIDAGDMAQVRRLNPHVDNGIVTPDGNTNLAVHTAAERWPWRGTVLAVRLARLLSVLMSVGTVLFTYLLAREFFADEPSSLLAAALVAFTPMFAFISGAVNNDNLASLLSAVILWSLVYFVRRADRFNWKHALGLGLLLGLAALTKQSALGLFPLTGLTFIAVSCQLPAVSFGRTSIIRHAKRSFVIRHSLITFGLAALVSGWWYVRNLVLYGDLLGWNAFIAVLGKRAAPASLAQLWGERTSFTRSYWGLFGGVNVPMPDWIYTVLNLIALTAIIGLLVFILQRLLSLSPFLPVSHSGKDSVAPSPLPRAIRAFPFLLLLAQLALLLYGLVQWATITWSSQGRLVFSGISAIAVLLVIGLRALTPQRARPVAFGAIGLFMAAVSFAVPFAIIAPKYADPPRLTDSQIAAIPHRTDADFGSLTFPAEMRLLGYGLEADAVNPGGSLRLTLYWQSLVAMDRDWSVFVHVVDDNGIVVAQRDTYPGMGLMPARKWAIGHTLADTYVLALPATTYAPAAARLEIGLYDYATGERLLIVSGDQSGKDALTLVPLTIAANAGEAPNPQALNFDNQIQLAGYSMDRRTVAPGQAVTLTLYWRGLKPIHTNYSVFAHVRGQGEALWAGADSWPQNGAAPTAAWTPGALIAETRALTLKPDTPPGVYDVEVGLYDASGNRLQLVLPDGRRTDNFVFLCKIRVQP
ncbi:MAG: glycosyltransferase family 39 protein [Chloroflexi bacterium]|nr:glycosyltransferase family 39 protein [Chloroflexota bacterium]